MKTCAKVEKVDLRSSLKLEKVVGRQSVRVRCWWVDTSDGRSSVLTIATFC